MSFKMQYENNPLLVEEGWHEYSSDGVVILSNSTSPQSSSTGLRFQQIEYRLQVYIIPRCTNLRNREPDLGEEEEKIQTKSYPHLKICYNYHVLF